LDLPADFLGGSAIAHPGITHGFPSRRAMLSECGVARTQSCFSVGIKSDWYSWKTISTLLGFYGCFSPAQAVPLKPQGTPPALELAAQEPFDVFIAWPP
jgi:hypothetical protein